MLQTWRSKAELVDGAMDRIDERNGVGGSKLDRLDEDSGDAVRQARLSEPDGVIGRPDAGLDGNARRLSPKRAVACAR